MMSDAYADIGPSAPSRMQVHLTANELERMARQAAELSKAGPHADVPRALTILAKARELLGGDNG